MIFEISTKKYIKFSCHILCIFFHAYLCNYSLELWLYFYFIFQAFSILNKLKSLTKTRHIKNSCRKIRMKIRTLFSLKNFESSNLFSYLILRFNFDAIITIKIKVLEVINKSIYKKIN